MNTTNSKAVTTIAETEPLESESGVKFPAVAVPPERDLYPTAIDSPEVGQYNETHLTESSTPPISETEATVIRITVTSPVKETVDGKLPGMKSSFHTYLINTTTTMRSFSQSEMAVRRRFRDFVALSNLLNENYRGFFVPPRPHRSWYQGKFLMKPKFIEERRVLLERYLRALASHPTISTSNEFRVFLETRGKLAEAQTWHELHNESPSLLQGTTKFFRQMVGKERLTPSAEQMSKPANLKGDFVWSFRNSIKNLDNRRRQAPYSGQEFELREERAKMEDFKKDVEASWKAASVWIDRTDALARASETLARVLTDFTNFETDARYLRLDSPSTISKACEHANQIYSRCLKECAGPLSTIHSYTEMMRPVLAALKSREKALANVQMLEQDLRSKQSKTEQLRIQPSKEAKLNQMEEDIKEVERSLGAARSFYDQVASTNIEETTRFRTIRSEEWLKMLKQVAEVQHNCYLQLLETWTKVAEELGADSKTIASIKETEK